jgi:hypothetical protein
MKLRVVYSVSLIGLACSSLTWAQEIPIEMKGCYSSETTIIDRAGDVIIGMNIVRGVTDNTGPGSFPAKTMHDCRVVFTASKAGVEFSNRCNFVDAQGDKILSVSNGTPDAYQWKWVAGTGKFEGITGSGTGKTDAVYPRANPTISGACWSGKGTYSIKK